MVGDVVAMNQVVLYSGKVGPSGNRKWWRSQRMCHPGCTAVFEEKNRITLFWRYSFLSFLHGPRREWGWGWWAPLPPLFWQINHYFFLLKKTRSVFYKKSTLHYFMWPLRKRCLFLICPFRSNLVFWGISRTNTAGWGSVSLGLFLNRRKMIHF